jgi:hypothetical protein
MFQTPAVDELSDHRDWVTQLPDSWEPLSWFAHSCRLKNSLCREPNPGRPLCSRLLCRLSFPLPPAHKQQKNVNCDTGYTTVCHSTRSWASSSASYRVMPLHNTQACISLTFIVISFSYLFFGLPVGLLPRGYQNSCSLPDLVTWPARFIK